jgi:hypothetical protein
MGAANAPSLSSLKAKAPARSSCIYPASLAARAYCMTFI